MSRNEFPVFLIEQIPAAADAGPYLAASGALAPDHGGRLLVAAESRDVECLETGTPPASLLIVEFTDVGALHRFRSSGKYESLRTPLEALPGFIALAVKGLPYTGLPDMPEIPSTASVTPPEDRGPRSYMTVQGVTTDQRRMDQYRDIILPMIAAEGAYYICFEIEGDVERLGGNWPFDIFAISRWPDHAAGHAFWDSDRYQNVAIPTRTGAGEFWVHFAPGQAG